ncbi:hypothetical protein BDW02DRAFT_596979 [Decorospora gaudefroyi]|uniref:BTB domain-containing protein n=1 Tax=Decorospora gaudefroyi TaxID=184978 RepID=A0A6A5KIP4_9PLEO|nr:hypothetical protein BDW02DRAFT_596979 [Decorospora gaudefroyi]
MDDVLERNIPKFIPSLAFSIARKRSTTSKTIKPPGKNWPRAFEKRQRAYQVSKSIFRHASKAWNTMVSGNWAESNMSEISLPDDSCDVFNIIMFIAHWQFDKLPATLTPRSLVDIALMSDKYDLGHLLRAVAEQKNWLQPYKDNSGAWASDINLQDFTHYNEFRVYG